MQTNNTLLHYNYMVTNKQVIVIIRLGNYPNSNYQVAFQTDPKCLFFLVVNVQCPMLYYMLVLKIKLIISTL